MTRWSRGSSVVERLLTALLLALVGTPAVAQPTRATIAALPPGATAGRGATTPFDEYEAENAATDGEPIGPDRRFTTLAAEASGRRAVRLAGTGRYVAFTLARAANALTVRYAVPDSADGKGLDATLGVYVGGERIASLATTSRYGWFYGKYPFTNRPGDGLPHHFYDHARLLLPRMLPAGTIVRLMIGPRDTASWYAIDLADFEIAPPPLPAPADALSVTGFGADATGARDSAAAFRRAIAQGRRRARPVWVPPGTFRIDGHLRVDRVTIAGAGIWHSILRGHGVGLYGGKRASAQVVLRDFAIIGEVMERNDHQPLAGVGGAMGGGSLIERLWLQHEKVGLWFDGPMDRITIRDSRILDMTADGLNFHRGVSNALVENNFLRGTGDDGLAAWSHRQADHHLVFRRNTVIAPVLANGIAIYGGHDITVADNLVADTLTQGGGLHVGNRFDAVPVSGDIALDRNTLVRSGSFDPNWRFGVGALWFYALDAPMTATIGVRDVDIVDSSEEAVQFIGKPITGIGLTRIRIDGAKSHAFQLQGGGAATIKDVTASGLGDAAILDCGGGFRLADRGGNSGLAGMSSQGCGAAPR